MTHVLAAEGGYQTFYLHGGEWTILLASVATALLAILVGFFLMRGVLAADEGTEKMKEIAKAIQEGAMAYLRRQFKTIAVILVPLAIIVFLTSTKVKQDSLSLRNRACSAPARSSSVVSCRDSPGSSA
jgi:K(+)-stimulated pyrophosphate-energized sodium pump